MNAENLLAILQSLLMRENQNDAVQYSMIVNQKLDSDNNYLHFLIGKCTEQNFLQVSWMIKLMIANKCSPNSPNSRLETPFYLLLTKFRGSSIAKELVAFFIQHSEIDFCSYNRDEIIEAMEEMGMKKEIHCQITIFNDVNFMNNLLVQWNETKFIESFENFKSTSKTSDCFENDCSILLETAATRNMLKSVTMLLEFSTSVNRIAKDSKHQIPPAFIATYYGHHEVLEVLLKIPSLEFQSSKRNLLHQVCLQSKNLSEDRHKCFELLIADHRCTQKVVNEIDDMKNVPLFYACKNGYGEIAIELMRRGAFIGHESVLANMSKSVLKEFFDECITSSDNVHEKNCEVEIDYRCFDPHNASSRLPLEVNTIRVIAESPKLKELISHPLISSFLYLKWRKINWLVYFNLLVYFCFMAFLGYFIMNLSQLSQTEEFELSSAPKNNETLESNVIRHPREIEYDQALVQNRRVKRLTMCLIISLCGHGGGGYVFQTEPTTTTTTRRPTFQEINDKKFEEQLKKNATSFNICVIGVSLMFCYEVIQFLGSFKNYFFKLSNWLDIVLIFFAFQVLSNRFVKDTEDFKKIRSFTILVMGAQINQLIANISTLSLHMAIFKKVCTNFLKTTFLYLVLILAFAMSFYTMKEAREVINSSISTTNEEKKYFDKPTGNKPRQFK